MRNIEILREILKLAESELTAKREEGAYRQTEGYISSRQRYALLSISKLIGEERPALVNAQSKDQMNLEGIE